LRGDLESLRPSAFGTFLTPAETLYVKENIFSKLSRYETAIERTLYRALHELEPRQAAWGGAAVASPQILDIDVSGMPGQLGSWHKRFSRGRLLTN
jgi:hypothetical protein